MLTQLSSLNKQSTTELCSVLGIKPHCHQSLMWTKMFCVEGRVPASLFESFKSDEIDKMLKDFASKISNGEDMRLASQILAANKEPKVKKRTGDARFGKI